jgi:hypothetical protein
MKKRTMVVMMLFAGYSLAPSVEAQKTESANSPAPAAPGITSSEPAAHKKVTAGKDSAAPIAVNAEGGFARLILRSQPDSADIVIDSTDIGQTPATIDSVSPGMHVILIKKKGYFVKKITTTIAPDSLHEISVVLIKPGCIVVKSEPTGAALFIDKKEVGATPYESAKLKPGNYTLRLSLEKHETVERSIIVAETGCDTLSINLPISKAYTDSVERAKKAAVEKKRKFKKTVDLIVMGTFLVFGTVIFFIEAGNAD